LKGYRRLKGYGRLVGFVDDVEERLNVEVFLENRRYLG
jgi:hypothetical protein